MVIWSQPPDGAYRVTQKPALRRATGYGQVGTADTTP
jgi:hypothetical protein